MFSECYCHRLFNGWRNRKISTFVMEVQIKIPWQNEMKVCYLLYFHAISLLPVSSLLLTSHLPQIFIQYLSPVFHLSVSPHTFPKLTTEGQGVTDTRQNKPYWTWRRRWRVRHNIFSNQTMTYTQFVWERSLASRPLGHLYSILQGVFIFHDSVAFQFIAEGVRWGLKVEEVQGNDGEWKKRKRKY